MGGVAQTPSERIVAEAGAPLFKALGPGLSANDRYVGYAMLAYCVTGIDDVPIPVPANEAQVEGLVQRLGDAGLVGVGEGMAAATPGNG